MADDVIKNPRRGTPNIQVPYEPEHVKKGIVVPEAPIHTASAAVGSSKKRDPNPPQEMFVSVDGDDLDEEGNVLPYEGGHVIDNNDYVNFGYNSPPQPVKTEEVQLEDTAVVAPPDVGEYILMVLGKLIASGSIEKIELRVKNIMYGDDPAFVGIEVSTDDIVVLKRINIRVGIFIDR